MNVYGWGILLHIFEEQVVWGLPLRNLFAFRRIMLLASRRCSKVSLKVTIPNIFRLSIFVISNNKLSSRFKWIKFDLRRMWQIYLLSFCLIPRLKNMLKALVCLSYPRSHDCRNQGESGTYMSLSNVKGALYSFSLRPRLFSPTGFYCYLVRFLMRQHGKHHLVVTGTRGSVEGSYYYVLCQTRTL